MQTMGGKSGMAPAAALLSGLKDAQTQSCMAIGGKIADGQAALRLALPKQHLIEIVTAAMQVQQQTMKMQQEAHGSSGNMSPEMIGTPAPPKVDAAPANPLMEWIGKPAPDLKMVDLQGNVNRVSRLKGKKVMLDFWATWCPPCKKSIPELIKLRTDTKPSKLAIFGLSDEPIDRLNEFTKEAKMNYPVVAYNNGDLPTPYNQVKALPTLILIDSKGIIRDILVGYHPIDEIKSKLDKLN